jgi:neutral ceramidase
VKNDVMKLGVATADITPPVGVTLMGYGRRPSESVGHLLRAEALACEGEGGGWILICADVCAFSSPLATVVRAEIGARTGLAPEAVMLTATHTHSGPYVTDALWSEHSELESAYFKALRDKLVMVAEQAWQARFPGTIVHATTTAPELGSNRRVQKEDGTWTNEWSDPEGRHAGYNDSAVELVGVRRDDNSLQALLVNFGCHPVCFGSQNHAISGDYVSYLKDALESERKADTVLFTVSGHGNVDPRDCVQADVEAVRTMGRKLAEIVSRALPCLAKVDDNGVAAVYEPWTFKTTWKLTGRRLNFYPHATRGTLVSTGVSALAAGEVVLLGLPGEAVSEYREKFRQRSPFAHTLLVSLANDFVGYLPSDEILMQGAYEAELSPLNPIEESLTSRADAALRGAHDGLP